MRELLENLDWKEDPGDPVLKAQKAMLTPLPKRFYKQAEAKPADQGFAVLLDGKQVRTPGRKLLVLPTSAAAELAVGEWQAQETQINPHKMPVNRIVNTALDGIAEDTQAVAEDIVRFAASDLLCYRADAPLGLVEMQDQHWNPVMDWFRDAVGANFMLAEGINHVTQPREAIALFSSRLRAFTSPLDLACLHVITTLTGSGLLALAFAEGALDSEAVWAAANVDEDWNVARWGEDAEAAVRRAIRHDEMAAAASLFKALR
ncbi:MAG: ATP12 family protein [Rhizobiaceae bacterium]